MLESVMSKIFYEFIPPRVVHANSEEFVTIRNALGPTRVVASGAIKLRSITRSTT